MPNIYVIKFCAAFLMAAFLNTQGIAAIAQSSFAAPLASTPAVSLPATTPKTLSINNTAKEIEYLFSYLNASTCEFNRNGSWYSAQKATSHLRDKYAYLVKKNLVPSTEAFIERAASKSSMSGTPYLVKCSKAEAIQSAAWFTKELKKYRATANTAANKN